MAILASVSILSGCATIVNGRFQTVTMKTLPAGAKCDLKNNKGSWVVNKTPGDVKVHRSIGDMRVDCVKPGYAETRKTIPSQPKKMLAGNLVFGGLIGAGIDTASGSGFSYPSEMEVYMPKSNQKHG